MTQAERRVYMIKRLLLEQEKDTGIYISEDKEEQKRLLRSLFNIRMPKGIDGEFLTIQDEYLKEEIAEKGITDLKDMEPVSEGIYLWQGDITTLRCDVIVNAANSGMTAVMSPAINVLITASTLLLGYSCGWNVQNKWENRGMRKKRVKRRLHLRTTFPANMFCIPLAPLSPGR